MHHLKPQEALKVPDLPQHLPGMWPSHRSELFWSVHINKYTINIHKCVICTRQARSRGNLVVSEVISGASVRRRGLTRWLPIDLWAFVITSLQRNSLSLISALNEGGVVEGFSLPHHLRFGNVPPSQAWAQTVHLCAPSVAMRKRYIWLLSKNSAAWPPWTSKQDHRHY